MTGDVYLGALNGHSTGRLLKETVRRAISTVRRERIVFEAHTKESYAGVMDDVFTSADKHAQEVYLRAFTECFPDCGVIAEEGELSIPSKNGLYFTVDPIDGTKAFTRRQSHGVSTMVALANTNGTVLSAYVGDTNTFEVYGYRPGSEKVHRITDLDSFEVLDASPPKDPHPSKLFALLRDPPEEYSDLTQVTIKDFKNYEVMGSSIGTWAARLWKREVQALFLTEGFETPWDSTPVIGISKMLGYGFFRPNAFGLWEAYEPELPQEPTRRNHDIMITNPQVLQYL